MTKKNFIASNLSLASQYICIYVFLYVVLFA